MTVAVKRKLKIDGRVAELQAQATIKKNVILALVELITNSDDSYRRLENANRKIDGRIIIELIRKRHGSVIRLIDFAEGFNDATMDDRVGTYGGDTSGFTEKIGGRGYWGRGLKEAIIAMGSGSVQSIKNNMYYECVLEGLEYTLNQPLRVTEQIRGNLGIINNGTRVELRITNEGITIPQYGSLKNNLEFYYSLRNITTNAKRKLILIEKNADNKIEREEQLSYILPKGKLYRHVTIPVKNYIGAYINLDIYRSNEPLSGNEEGPIRENGILICSKGSILEITLTKKYEDNKYACNLYGHATCDYIDHLLRTKNESIIRSDRGGLDWRHPFCRAIEDVLAKEIADYVLMEEKREKEDEQRIENEKTRRRYIAALPEINNIAKMELDQVEGLGEGNDKGRPIKMPGSGFEFDPDYTQIVIDKEGTLTLKAIVPYAVQINKRITITSDTKEIVPITKEIVFSQAEVDNESGLAVGRVKIIGKQVGTEGIVTAEVDDLKAEALIKVISKRKIYEGGEPAKRSGLFKGYKFNKDADARHRVNFDRDSGNIIIATRAPSVAMYFGLNGEGQEEGHCQVMLAELVVESVCKEIARQKIESGKESYIGEKSNAINYVSNRLINKYADKIHRLLVDKKFWRFS